MPIRVVKCTAPITNLLPPETPHQPHHQLSGLNPPIGPVTGRPPAPWSHSGPNPRETPPSPRPSADSSPTPPRRATSPSALHRNPTDTPQNAHTDSSAAPDRSCRTADTEETTAVPHRC